LRLAAGATALLALPRSPGAESYPTRAVRVIVGQAAGTSPDAIARLFAQWLSERFGQPFVIENLPGAGSNIATDVVAHAPADGYTLLLSSLTNAINATLYSDLRFDFNRDMAPVALLGDNAFVMVASLSVPTATVPEFIAYAKANPGRINMASGGIGSAPHVFGELFKEMAGVDLVHVPYHTSFYPDLFTGRVQVAFSAIAGTAAFIRDGKLRALAVTTAHRSPALPEIPAMNEYVPGYEASAWLGIAAPKRVPVGVVAKLNNEINAIVADPGIKARLVGMGIEPKPMTPAETAKFTIEETEKWARVIKAAGIKAD